MSNACSWRALAVTATVFVSLVLVVNPSAGLSLDVGDGTPIVLGAQRDTAPMAEFVAGAEVPVLIGTAAFFLIIGFLLFWTSGSGGDE